MCTRRIFTLGFTSRWLWLALASEISCSFLSSPFLCDSTQRERKKEKDYRSCGLLWSSTLVVATLRRTTTDEDENSFFFRFGITRVHHFAFRSVDVPSTGQQRPWRRTACSRLPASQGISLPRPRDWRGFSRNRPSKSCTRSRNNLSHGESSLCFSLPRFLSSPRLALLRFASASLVISSSTTILSVRVSTLCLTRLDTLPTRNRVHAAVVLP